LTPHAAIAHEDGLAMHYWLELDAMCRFCFIADGKNIVALAHSLEHLLEICDVILRLLAVSVVHRVILTNWSRLGAAFINAPSLAYMMEQCQSLEFFSLNGLQMDENHCRVLGDLY
jgi:hypothetical protein